MRRVDPVQLDFTAQDIDGILTAIRSSLSTGQLAQGEQVAAFEAEFAACTGARNAVAVASGTAALVCGLRAIAGQQEGEVLVAANTFYASAAAPLLAGLRTRLVDVDAATFAPSVADLDAALTSETIGVMLVHTGGIISPATPEIAQWCDRHGLWLLEDCAHAHGSRMGGQHAGTFGAAGAFSFFATKVITSAEGGMVITDDDELAQRLRVHRNLGKPELWRSYHTVLGENARMSELHAAVGRAQLARLDEFVATRARLARRYTSALAELPAVSPVLPDHDPASWYKYIVLLDPHVDRRALKAALAERGVRLGGEVYELPLHRQPVFAERLPAGEFPVSEQVCGRHVCLPLHTGMGDDDVDFVVAQLARTSAEMSR
ncbi:DegT/DnrJ/EryC1/StrS family aminotransferase [Saccharopolyspora sp. NPDC000359]|uniref:DegT/DnrJ/EryC1/StrS family aminotransferase n=1 Tax=Saccharopolyspora sp. NPDC000359 TaxID=3154251 RepID=UPI00332E541E